MKYKIGDRVRVKSLDWYNENKSERGFICFAYANFIPEMTRYCGEILTINQVVEEHKQYFMSECVFAWTDEMIEGLVEESDDFEKMYTESEKRYEEEYSKGEYCHEQSFKWGFQEGYNYSHENDKLEISLKEGYQFKDENGNVINATKIILEKKKKEYPKTYAECLSVLGIYNGLPDVEIYNAKPSECKLFESLIRLKRCRDAYWKIAGEEMGLGKPWEPSDSDYITGRYCIFVHQGNIICSTPAEDCPLTFPTEEMRDAFYENFKEDIEICKELL